MTTERFKVFDACFHPESLASVRRKILRGESFKFHRHPANLYPLAEEFGRRLITRKLETGGWIVSSVLITSD